MSPEQKTLVKESWQSVALLGDTAARVFYDRLFEIDQTAGPLFKAANMEEQRKKLLQVLTVVVQGLDQLEALLPTVEELGRRHAQYGVSSAHYESVGAALLWTLEQALDTDWTPELKVAWSGIYGQLANIMRDAAGQAGAAA